MIVRRNGAVAASVAATHPTPRKGGSDMATNISMTESTESLQAQTAKRVLIVASDPAVSDQTGWPIGFWWEELTHSYREFTEAGYQVVIASPKGGRLQADDLSDPRDERRLEADDLLSLGFINSPEHMALLED